MDSELEMKYEGRQCQVVLCDGRTFDITVKPKLLAEELLDIATTHFSLSLKEKEYFGLAYAEDESHYSWLDPDRKVLERKLPKTSTDSNLIFHFGIKCFPEKIVYLRDSATVEAFYLHTKSLVYQGILEVDGEKAFQMAALVLQAKHGDYSSDILTKKQMEESRVLPRSVLNGQPSFEVCEKQVIEQYITLEGLSRGAAIVKYMCIAESLPTYGMHFYEVKDINGKPWCLGINCKGIFQYDMTDRKKAKKAFFWSQFQNLHYRKKKFSMSVLDPMRLNPSSENIFSPYDWFADSPSLAKSIWSMALSQQNFHHRHSQDATHSRNINDLAEELSCSILMSSPGRSSLGPSARELYQGSLKERIEALERTLREMSECLKTLCVKEAELTGVLPPEMPLGPGDKIAIAKKNAGGRYELLWRMKTKEEQVYLVLEQDIQRKIISTCKKLSDDFTLKKKIRRQMGQFNQKAVQKMREIDREIHDLRKRGGWNESSKCGPCYNQETFKDEAYFKNETGCKDEICKTCFKEKTCKGDSHLKHKTCSDGSHLNLDTCKSEDSFKDEARKGDSNLKNKTCKNEQCFKDEACNSQNI